MKMRIRRRKHKRRDWFLVKILPVIFQKYHCQIAENVVKNNIILARLKAKPR